MMNWNNSGVTIELGELVDSGVNIWDFDYPIPRQSIEYNGKVCQVDFDKATFEQKIIDHFRFRQIGQETPGRWLHYFRTRIREIMPYYVQLYEFDAKFRNIEDPLESYNLVEEYLERNSGSSEGSGTSTGRSERDVRFSDTPQGVIQNVREEGYLTNLTLDADQTQGSSTSESSSSGEVEHTLTRKGNIGVQPLGGEVENIRSAFINIDLQIINELKDLFLQVY